MVTNSAPFYTRTCVVNDQTACARANGFAVEKAGLSNDSLTVPTVVRVEDLNFGNFQLYAQKADGSWMPANYSTPIKLSALGYNNKSVAQGGSVTVNLFVGAKGPQYANQANWAPTALTAFPGPISSRSSSLTDALSCRARARYSQ